MLENEVANSLFIDRKDNVLKDIDVENDLKPIRVGMVNKGGQGERIYSTAGHAITLSAFGGGVGAKTGLYLVGGRVRRLSINESKKIMGYKKDFHVSDGVAGYRQLGDAVIPAMIEKVWDKIRVA